MKKITITLLSMLFALPTYATTVTGTGTECNENTLNTDTGPATLQAQWDANTINLSWYSDGSAITPSNNAAGTCTYDGGITLPTNTMTKEGYTFAGWRVRTLFDLTSLSAYIDSPNGKGSGSINQYGDTDGDPEKYGLTLGEWATEFDYGVVKGIYECRAATDGSYNHNCWCQINGFDPEADGSYLSVASPAWADTGSTGYLSCDVFCAKRCSWYASEDWNIRRDLYGVFE